ncbi:MAG TPA: hypothetical protein VN041_13945 [Microbacterium sp.]|nr:hypothetical protein [Microbacterium sp.]
MDITLPTIPAGVLVLLGLVSPFAVALINGAVKAIRKPWQKKAVAILVAIILTAVVLWFYYAYTGDVVPQWPALVLLTIVVGQFSYSMVTKTPASALEQRISPTITVHESPDTFPRR